jgi:CSLREA domain-containing protein
MKNIKINLALHALIGGLSSTHSRAAQTQTIKRNASGRILSLVFALIIFCAASSAASAATITVNSLADTQANDGACTLREAITNANADNQTGSADCAAGAGADTINITTAGTISLLAALPDLTTDMTINGLGTASTIVSRNAGAATEFRIFTKAAGTSTISNLTARDGIARGATAATGGLNGGGGIANLGGQLTLTNVTVTNNRAIGGNGTGGAGGEADGGGIYSSAALIVTNSTISNNTATGGNGTGAAGGIAFGGGVFMIGATLTVSDSTVSGNTAAGGTGATNGSSFGGGINVNNNASLNMTNSTVSNNMATGEGGITNINGTATLTNSIVSGNTATNSGGGGIGNSTGTLTLTNSTVSNNSATNGGGGGLINFSTANVINSTFSGNTVNNFTGGAISNQASGILNLTNSTVSGNSSPNSNGGGLRNLGTANLSSSTFSNNSAAGTGGGISNSGTTTLDNTIIANSPAGGDCVRPGGTINATYSLIEQNLACVNGTNTNNLTGDPNLGALANNGGATQTHALQTGSIAIDTGNSALTTDQRGFTRPVDSPGAPNGTGNLADIGSFEVQGAATGGVSTTYTVTKTADTNDGVCDADCSLREAVGASNANVGGADQINFAASLAGQTITLTAGQLSLNDTSGTLTINGLGATQLTVSGNNASRVFNVGSGANVSVSGLTVTAARASGDGGAFAAGTSSILTLNSLRLNNNYADSGAGILASPGSTVNLSNSTVSNGTTLVSGGSYGGGIYNNAATVNVTNSTVSGNAAGNGGGILNNGGTTNLDSVTLSNNTANAGSGGGVRNLSGTMTLNNTIVANSTTGGECARTGGTINASYSLIEDNLTCVNGATNTNNLTGDPNLAPLGFYGGQTPTHAFALGVSIAIDKGSTTLATDQRGFARPVDDPNIPNASAPSQAFGERDAPTAGNGADIGAVEQQSAPTAATVTVSGKVTFGAGGRGINRAIVSMTGADGTVRRATTNAFGYYRFADVAAGETYVFNVKAKTRGIEFGTQVLTVSEDINDLNFTGQ